MDKKDMVNHPSHYADSCSMECFDAMLVAFGVEYMVEHCKITAFKYLWRHSHKGGEEDVRKALWYLNKAKQLRDGEEWDDTQLCELLKQASAAIAIYAINKDDSVCGKPDTQG